MPSRRRRAMPAMRRAKSWGLLIVENVVLKKVSRRVATSFAPLASWVMVPLDSIDPRRAEFLI